MAHNSNYLIPAALIPIPQVETTLTRAVDELAGGIFDNLEKEGEDDGEDRERVVNLPIKERPKI